MAFELPNTSQTRKAITMMNPAARQHYVRVVLLGAVVAAVFLPAISYEFLPFDDDVNILFNPHHGPLTLHRIGWAFGDLTYVRRYLPLGWLAISATSTLSQLAPWGYHAANIALHVTNAMLLAVLIWRLLADWVPQAAAARPEWLSLAALFSAGWWALHPLRVECVAWCSAIPTNLALTFLLAALLAHRSSRPFAWPGSILLFAAALLSYPAVLGAGVFFPVLDWIRGQKRILLRAAPFVALTLACGFVNLYARVMATAENAPPPTLAEFPLGLRITQAGCVWAHYLWRPWYPFSLAPVYRDFLHLHYASFQVIGSAALLALAAVLAGRSRVRWLWLASYGVVVFPFTGFTESPHFPSDRYAVLPDLMMAAALALVFFRLQSRLTGLVASLLLLTLAGLSRRQLPLWQNEATLTQAIRSQLAPGDVPAIRDLRPAIWKFRAGDYQGAFDLLDHEIKARGRAPELAALRRELAGQFENERQYAVARGLSVAAVPPVALLHQRLAGEYLRAGELEPAAWHLAEIKRLAPAYYDQLAGGRGTRPP
jgi:protein O-mannosyl-transferase